MAGDWIKVQKDTPDKPEVLAIAARLGIDPDAVTGKLIRIWSWFDTHTTNGNALSVTFSFLDRLTGVTGFAEQVAMVGWLEQNGHELTLPNFNFHNGETAKKRAMGKNRTEKSRSNAESNASSVTNTLPEKRREEKSNVVAKATTSDKSLLSPPSEKKKSASPEIVFPEGLDQQAWSQWIEYRKAAGKALKPVSWPTAMQALVKHGPNQMAVVNQSIANGWQGLFAIKPVASTIVHPDGRPLNKQEALEASNRAVVERLLRKEGWYDQQ